MTKIYRKTVKGWTDDYAHAISDKVRESLADYADDVAHAMFKEAKAAFQDVLNEIYDADAILLTKTEAKQLFDEQLKQSYESIVSGARDADKQR